MHNGLREVIDRRYIYIDFNSFFASIEQQSDPSLAHKPVAVVSHHGPTGTVLAASYEAKRFGIRTGTRIRDANLLCPSITYKETHPALYKNTHRHFLAILTELCGPEVQAKSIDEAAIPLAPNWRTPEFSWDLAREIKRQFKTKLGEHIHCSLGIAPNIFLAKLATDLQKPDGLIEITGDSIPGVLETLQLTDLCGIAKRSAIQLAHHGIATPLSFYQESAEELQRKFGAWGQYWWWRLHGYEVDSYISPLHQSLSHQHVLKKWLYSLEEVQPVVIKMAERLICRLRNNGLQCSRVSIYFSLADSPGFYAEHSFDSPTNTYPLLVETFRRLIALPALNRPIRKITISFHGISPSVHGVQGDLFSTRIPQEHISRALENIRNRYGFNAVHLGSTLGVGTKVAKEQLGFGRIRDVFYQ
jgi:DNA polymerase-4